MAARVVTSAVLGALAVVLGWAAWSTLGPREPSESALRTETSVAQAAPTAAPRPVVQPSSPGEAAPRPAPVAPARPEPLREGLVMEHGMPVATHALAEDDATAALPLPTVALPAGVLAADAVVNRAGMVTLTRSGDGQAPADASTAAPRPATLTRAP